MRPAWSPPASRSLFRTPVLRTGARVFRTDVRCGRRPYGRRRPRRRLMPQTTGRMLGAVSADARMLGAVSADVAGAVDPRRLARSAAGRRPLRPARPRVHPAHAAGAARDVRPLFPRRGPRDGQRARRGPVLLVGNHSGGTLIVDTFVFAQAFYDHFGADREFSPARPRSRLQGPRFAGRAHAVRNGAGVAGEHAAGARARRRTARVSRAATTRPTERRGTPRTSTSPTGPGSCGSR